MAEHHKKGKLGEALALDYLVVSGLQILETNWRQGKAEIDIIFKEGDTMVFVEVKTRTTSVHGSPELAVSLRKQKLIGSAAARYMELSGHDWKIRFDVISIIAKSREEVQIEHFKDAFLP